MGGRVSAKTVMNRNAGRGRSGRGRVACLPPVNAHVLIAIARQQRTYYPSRLPSYSQICPGDYYGHGRN